MKYNVKIATPTDVHNWDDLLDPSKKDNEDYVRDNTQRIIARYKESIEILKHSDFLLSITRKGS